MSLFIDDIMKYILHTQESQEIYVIYIETPRNNKVQQATRIQVQQHVYKNHSGL